MSKIKKIKKKSLAIFSGFFYFFLAVLFVFGLGLVTAIDFLLIGDFSSTAWKELGKLLLSEFFVGLLAVVGNFVIGWLIGYFVAMVYNLAARWLGGLEIDLVSEQTQTELDIK